MMEETHGDVLEEQFFRWALLGFLSHGEERSRHELWLALKAETDRRNTQLKQIIEDRGLIKKLQKEGLFRKKLSNRPIPYETQFRVYNTLAEMEKEGLIVGRKKAYPTRAAPNLLPISPKGPRMAQ